MDFTIQPITEAQMPAFAPYLLAVTTQMWQEDSQGMVLLGLVADGTQACGAVAGVQEGEAFHLINLYVDEHIRGQGLGRKLVETLLEQVAPGTPVQANWMLPQLDFSQLDSFLQHLGFGPAQQVGAPTLRLDTRVMRTLPVIRRAFSPNFRPDSNIVAIKDLTQEEWDEVAGDETIAPELRLNSLAEEELHSPFSFAYRYGGKIVAYFLAIPAPDGASILPVVSRQGAHPAAFLQLTTAAIHASLPYLPGGDGYYWTNTTNAESLGLAQRLSGDQAVHWHQGKAIWVG